MARRKADLDLPTTDHPSFSQSKAHIGSKDFQFDPVASAAESKRFHDEFDPPATPHHQRPVYSDGRDIGGTWGSEATNRDGDLLGDCSAHEQSREGERSLRELARASRRAERAGR